MSESAAGWLARRDRGLTAAEQDSYLQWLNADPRHGRMIALMERGWQKLDKLSDWRPTHSKFPNPDLLAPPRRSNSGLMVALMSSAAVMAVLLSILWPMRPRAIEPQHVIIHPRPERVVLEDGSVVELKGDARIEVDFTPDVRRIRLLQGEAYFSVAKDPTRPFVVAADRVDVRAVGTEFSVSLGDAAVSVLVTEGKVRVDEARPGAPDGPPVAHELSHVTAGQQAVIEFAPGAAHPEAAVRSVLQIRDITPVEIERALAWQSMRLEFVDMPLRDVIREFNRYNVRKLTVADEATGALRIGGNFHAADVEAFVRLLDSGFGVAGEARGSEIELRYHRRR